MTVSEKYGIKTIEYECVDSTNNAAKAYAQSGEWTGERCIFIANEQTSGRGRYSRKFYSEAGVGVYLSLLFKPETAICDTTPIVAIAANSMIKAIEKQVDTHLEIKWVNDLILRGKKVGGILIEGGFSASGKGFDYLVVGIGVNLFSSEINAEIREIATSIEDETSKKCDKEMLVRAFINEFFEALNGSKTESFDFYKSRLITLGKAVTIHTLNEKYDALARELLPDFSLLVTLPNGEEKRIFTGEASLKAVDKLPEKI